MLNNEKCASDWFRFQNPANLVRGRRKIAIDISLYEINKRAHSKLKKIRPKINNEHE